MTWNPRLEEKARVSRRQLKGEQLDEKNDVHRPHISNSRQRTRCLVSKKGQIQHKAKEMETVIEVEGRLGTVYQIKYIEF